MHPSHLHKYGELAHLTWPCIPRLIIFHLSPMGISWRCSVIACCRILVSIVFIENKSHPRDTGFLDCNMIAITWIIPLCTTAHFFDEFWKWLAQAQQDGSINVPTFSLWFCLGKERKPFIHFFRKGLDIYYPFQEISHWLVIAEAEVKNDEGFIFFHGCFHKIHETIE